jgi:hypothetical protein
MSDENEDCIEIRARLTGAIVQKFRSVKSEKGLVADSEVVRQLIVDEFNRLTREEGALA